MAVWPFAAADVYLSKAINSHRGRQCGQLREPVWVPAAAVNATTSFSREPRGLTHRWDGGSSGIIGWGVLVLEIPLPNFSSADAYDSTCSSASVH